MSLVYRILITIVCLFLSFCSLRLGKRKKDYETGVDTLLNERRYSKRVTGRFFAFLFLLPLVSCWFPQWAECHNWNLAYAGIMLLILLFVVLPKVAHEEEKEELKKRSNREGDYMSAD